MFETLPTVKWANLPQPEWNQADSNPRSLQLLAVCNYESGWNGAYMEFLSAVGNNHAGTYYPAVLYTFPFLNEILISGNDISQSGVLNALMEIGTCFYPAPKYEYVVDSNGCETRLSLLVAHEIEKLLPSIQTLATHQNAETKKFALELLETLQDKTKQ